MSFSLVSNSETPAEVPRKSKAGRRAGPGDGVGEFGFIDF